MTQFSQLISASSNSNQKSKTTNIHSKKNLLNQYPKGNPNQSKSHHNDQLTKLPAIKTSRRSLCPKIKMQAASLDPRSNLRLRRSIQLL